MALSAGSVEIRLFAELARLQSDMKKANKVVEDAMGGIQKTVRATTSVFNSMAGAFSAGQIIKLADDYKRFDAQLKLSTKSLREYGEAYNNVIRIGRTAQSDIGAIGVLYARLNNNLRDFNVTQNQVASITETISLALRTNNATVQETNSVMLQLSQSFGSGKLNGQEFLAVAEGAPMLLRQLATSLGEPYGALKDLSAQGLITRDALLKAWSDPAYLAALRQQVKEVGTVTSSITVLMNNLKQYIGEADKATNATRALSWIITLAADNIDKLMNVAIAAGVAWLVKWSQAKYSAMVASKAHAAQEVISANIVQQAAIREAAIAESKLALDKLVLIGKVNLRAAKVADAEANALAAAGTIKEANAIKVLEAETLKLIKAKGALAAANGAVGVSMANNALAITRMAHAIPPVVARVGMLTTAFNGLKTLLAAFGGWIGIAITAVILFGDKILTLVDRLRGLTPELKKINEQIERNNQLRKIGTSIDDPMATQREEIANTVKEIARLQEMRDRVARMGKGAGIYMMLSTPAEKIAEIDAQIAQGRKNITVTMKSINEGNASVASSTNANSEAFGKLSEKLQTAKELAAEYANNQRLIIIEGNAAGLSQSEILAKLALLKDQYDKATGATKASKQATKDATEAEKLRAEGIKQLVLEQKAFVEAQEDARQAVILDAAQENQALATQIEKTQERIDLLNMGEEAQNRMVEARLQDAIATAEQNVQQAINNDGTKDAIKYAEDYLFTLKERLELRKKLSKLESEEERIKVIKAAEKERVKATKDANAEIERANDRLYSNLARSITDSIVRGFENGLSFIDNFKQAITNAFKSFFVNVGVNFVQGALEQTFGSITKGIFGSIATAFSGSAMAGGDGVATAGLLDQAKNVFNVVTKGFDATNIAFEQGIQQFGTWVTDFGSVGESLGGMISQYSGAIASALPYTGAALSLLQGDVKGAAFQGGGVAIGSLLGGPIGGAIGGMLGSVVGGMFGGHVPRPKYYADTRVSQTEGTLVSGWKNGDGERSVLAQTNQLFTDAAQSISDLANSIGGEIATAFQVSMTYNQKHNLYGINVGRGTTKGEWDVYGADGDLQGATVNAFLLAIKKGFIELPKYMTDALNRGGTGIDAVESLMAIRNMYESLDTLPEVFDAVEYSISNFAMATKESVTALQSQMQAIGVYVDLFYTSEEKLNILKAQLETQFSALNTSLPATRDGFRALVDGINVVDAATSDQFNGLIALAPVVDSYYKQLEAELAIKKQLVSLDINRFRTFSDFVIANSYANAGQPIPAANMPSYAVGTPYVPNDGVAMLHRGEAVLTRSENASMSVNSGRMVSLLGTLITKVSGLEYDMKRTADSSQRTVAELEDITGGYVTINTQAA